MIISDVLFDTQEMRPLAGTNLKFASKVKALYVEDSAGRHKVERSFPEYWGATAADAEAKALEKIKEWVNSQS